MSKKKYIELSSCVRGEHFKYYFSGGDRMQYVALLTQQQFEAYQKGFNKVDRIPAASPVVLTSDTDEEKLYLVRDMDGKEYL